MSLPSERIQPLNLPGLVMMMQQFKNGQLQQQEHQFNLGRLYRADSQQQAFQQALRSGDAAAAQAADPMAFIKLQQSGLETTKTKQEIGNLQSQQDERVRKADDKIDADTLDAQKRISATLEVQPESAGMLQSYVDAQAKAGKLRAFQVAGQHLLPADQAGPQVIPNQRETLGMQAMAGIDTAAKSRALSETTQNLRKEFTAMKPVQAYSVVHQGLGNILSASQNGVGDLNVIYSFMKMLDTNSAVRESETALAAGAGGFIQNMKAILMRAKGEGSLTPQLRQMFAAEAQKLDAAYRKGYDVAATNMGRIAAKAGASPEDVVFADVEQPASGGFTQAAVPQGNTSGGMRTIPYSVPGPGGQPAPPAGDPLDQAFDQMKGGR